MGHPLLTSCILLCTLPEMEGAQEFPRGVQVVFHLPTPYFTAVTYMVEVSVVLSVHKCGVCNIM